MRKVVYERFHGLQWIGLESNEDVPLRKPRPRLSHLHSITTSDYSPDLDSDSSVERIIEDAYTQVASKLHRKLPPPPRSLSALPTPESAYLPIPASLGKWAKGRVVRYPTVQKASPDVMKTIRTRSELSPSVTIRAHRTARARLKSVFQPDILAQLDRLGQQGLIRGPRLRAGKTRERGGDSPTRPIPSAVRRKYYGRWYLPTKQWAEAMQSAVHRSAAALPL